MPKNEIENKLVEIWSNTLGVSRISTNDNFFYLGGDSLLAIQLSILIHKELNTYLEISDIFNNPTIEHLSKVISYTQNSSMPEIKRAPELEYYDASPRMVFGWDLMMNKLSNSKERNMPLLICLNEELDIIALNKSLNMILYKHEAFRTSIIELDGALKLKINKPKNIQFTVVEDFKQIEDLSCIVEAVKNAIDVEFDFKKGELLNAWMFKLSNHRTILLLLTHHMVSDGLSMQILKRDLLEGYKKFISVTEEDKTILTTNNTQFKDYLYWLNEYISNNSLNDQKKFWEDKLRNKDLRLKLPHDFSYSNNEDFNAKKIIVVIKEELYLKVKEFCASRNITVFMLLSVVSNLTLYYWSKNKEITVAVQVSGRRNQEFINVVGYLVNVVFWNTIIDPESSMNQFISKTRNEVLQIFENQDYPDVNIKNDLNISNISVFYNFLNFTFSSHIDGFEEFQLNLGEVEEKSVYDLIFEGYKTNEGINVEVIYRQSLFKQSTIEDLGKNFLKVLQFLIENPQKTVADGLSVFGQHNKS